jgi:hypothetical protein
MHSHTLEKDKIYNYINDHLPRSYVSKTQKILKAKAIDISDNVIRNVKANNNTNNLDVLNALLKVAKAEKARKDELAETLQE